MIREIELTVNSRIHTVSINVHETLLHVLRERLGFKGVKEGCGTGECGACIVLRNGTPVNSCILPAAECDGDEVTTIEGVERESGMLHPIQQAFINNGAVQCGFCTPGMILTAVHLLSDNPAPSRDEIRHAISGNICRCTGYQKIVDAIEEAAEALRRESDTPTGDGRQIQEDYHQLVGTSSSRSDLVWHVKGKAAYVDDIDLPDMAYGKILRSEYAHAIISNIDTSEAEQMEGVLAVVTGSEVPEGYFGVDLWDQLVFARDKVRCRGDAVAAVAAVDLETAEAAVRQIRVDYQPLPAVFDAEEAMQDEAPIIHENLSEYTLSFDTEREGNVCTKASVQYGDTEAGFEQAEYIVEDVFETNHQHQCSLETHGAIARVEENGKISVWSSTQKPFAMRRYLSHALQRPVNTFNVTASAIGGGFGGKLELNVEPYCVVLAEKCRRPVKIIYSREEEFYATGARHKTKFFIKSGIDAEGNILARSLRYIYDTGAYSGNGPTTLTLSSQVATGLYRVRNLDAQGFCVYTNKMNCGSFRGPSAPQTSFVIESHTDNLAAKIGMDPVEFRLKNLLEPGEKTGVGQTIMDVDYKAVVKKAAEESGWYSFEKKENLGIGLGCVWWLSGGWATSVDVNINEDGTVTIFTGAVDMGTGYLYTSVPQLVGEVLGMPLKDIEVVIGNTDSASYDHGIGGSRGTFTIGKAAEMAAEDVKQKIFQAAAKKFNSRPDCFDMRDGWVYVKDNPWHGVSLAEISLEQHLISGGPLVGSSHYLPEMDEIEPERVKGLSFPAFKGNTIGCHVAIVEVDSETGQIDIKKYVAAHDVGKAINPQAVEGQIEGGVALGLGFGTSENLQIDEKGMPSNPNFADYKIPTSLDVPDIRSVIYEYPASYGPHGAKGLGEPTMAPVAAAVGNAVFHATGVRIPATPITPQRISRAIESDRWKNRS